MHTQRGKMTGSRILVFGAHPDDIEFGCGAVLLEAAARGAKIDLVVLSRGEAGTHGTRSIREKEALKAAEMMGAVLHFASTPGDTRLQADLDIKLLAAIEIRRLKPDLVFAPTGHLNQHPDHRETSLLVRDANRLARYGKTPGLENWEPHASRALLFYDISSEYSGMDGLVPILVDISSQVGKWIDLMKCHESQTESLEYVDLQLSRARALGVQAGVNSALRLYSEGPLLWSSIETVLSSCGPRL